MDVLTLLLYFAIKIGIEDTYNVVDKITDGKVEVNDLLSILKSFKTSGQPEVFPTSEMDGEYFSFFSGLALEAA